MRRTTDPTPLNGRDAILADLDGVVYRGRGAIPHAVEALNRASERLRVGYITNNASRRAEMVAEQLQGFGLRVTADDVVTSPQAALVLLRDLVPERSRVLVVGGDGLTSVLGAAGYEVVDSADARPAAVVQGFAPDVAWRDLAEAAFALQGEHGDIPWIATNTDWTIPQERGTAPGNGTLVSAVHTAIGRLPTVAGKPERAIFDAAAQRFGATSPIVIGDRLDTDILGAHNAGLPSIHVLTGIDQPKQLLAAAPDQRPDYILRDLSQLHEPYPEVRMTERRGTVEVRVGDAVVRRRQVEHRNLLTVEQHGEQIDLLRAGAAIIWASGLAIYGFDVPAELYA